MTLSHLRFKALFLNQVQLRALLGDLVPEPFLALHRDGKLVLDMLDLDIAQTQAHVKAYVQKHKPAALAYGIDRWNNKGATLPCVFCWTVYWDGKVSHGIVEYDPGKDCGVPDEGAVVHNRETARIWTEVVHGS